MIYVLFVSLIPIIVFYLAFSFIAVSFDITKWSLLQRELFSCFSIAFFVIVCIVDFIKKQ